MTYNDTANTTRTNYGVSILFVDTNYISLEETRALLPCCFALLIHIRQSRIERLNAHDFCRPFRPVCITLNRGDQFCDRPSSEEFVCSVVKRFRSKSLGCVSRRSDLEDGLQDVDVVRNSEQVPAVLVREEVHDLVEAAPSDAAQAETTRLVCREEDAVFRIRSRFFRACGVGLDAVYLAV